MGTDEVRFELPRIIERPLAALSKLYALDGQRLKQALIVNAHVRVEEGWSFDNWDGGTHGHALHLVVPDSLYVEAVRDLDALQTVIMQDLNKLHNIQNEFIHKVFIEMAVSEDHDWRQESGVLQAGRRQVSVETGDRIWGTTGFRVFLSHKDSVKVEAAGLKEGLERLGASAFVAHKDIRPTKEWQDEIENALPTMEAFVALLTDDFHKSDWTDQEVGYALCRGVPIIAVRLGRDPYGFIGKFQGLTCSWSDAPREITKLLLTQPRMVEGYVGAVERCPSFDAGNALAEMLPDITALTPNQVDRLVTAYDDNNQVSGSFGFNGKYGGGLASHLTRLAGRPYALTSGGKMQAKE